jgi:hypothetical protein
VLVFAKQRFQDVGSGQQDLVVDEALGLTLQISSGLLGHALGAGTQRALGQRLVEAEQGLAAQPRVLELMLEQLRELDQLGLLGKVLGKGGEPVKAGLERPAPEIARVRPGRLMFGNERHPEARAEGVEVAGLIGEFAPGLRTRPTSLGGTEEVPDRSVTDLIPTVARGHQVKITGRALRQDALRPVHPFPNLEPAAFAAPARRFKRVKGRLLDRLGGALQVLEKLAKARVAAQLMLQPQRDLRGYVIGGARLGMALHRLLHTLSHIAALVADELNKRSDPLAQCLQVPSDHLPRALPQHRKLQHLDIMMMQHQTRLCLPGLARRGTPRL